MSEITCNGVVLRIGEVFLKGDNRSWFIRRLVDNLARLLDGLPWRIRTYQGRILLVAREGEDPASSLDEVLERAGRCFGIANLSPAIIADEPDPEELARLAAALAAQTVPPTARTFRVTPRRPDKHLPFTSPQLGAIVGEAVRQAVGLPVDLARPDFVVGVEAGALSFVYTTSLPGAGGLPVGASGKALLLLSGGIDSPAAGWLMLKRGATLEAVHFLSPPYTGPASREKVVELCQVLARWGGPIRLHFIPITELQLQVKEKAERSLTVLLYRRFMVRLACRLAAEQKALALISGESLGQVASQTMDNLACIEAVADRPILRPLIAADKDETVRLAQRIGTFAISIRPHEDTCSLFVPRHPAIHGRPWLLEREEERLPLDELLERAWAARESVLVEG